MDEKQTINIEKPESNYEELINFMPIGIGIADMKGNLLYFNDSMLAPGSWKKEDIEKIGNVAGLYFDPGERAKALSIFQAQGRVDSFETRFKKKEGGYYYSLMSLRKIEFKGQEAMLSIVQDISAIKAGEEKNEKTVKELEDTKLAMLNLLEDLEQEKDAVEREKVRDEIIFSSIGSALIVTDAKGIIVDVNLAFESMTGFTAKELVGKELNKALAKYDQNDKPIPDSERPITKILQGIAVSMDISSASEPYYFTRKDKSKLYIVGTMTPIIIGDKVAGAVQVFSDITEERKIDVLKDEFLSIASHELRTPLTAIDGIVSMMMAGEYGQISAEMKKGLDDVNTSSERLIKLVNDLLSLSRMQAGRLKYTITSIYPDEIVAGEVHLFTAALKEKGLTIKTDKIPHIKVAVDADKVKQVLGNLFSNCLKFTGKGGITLRGIEKGDFVVIEVTDTGMGISKPDREKLFGKFQQIGDTGNVTGTGLGLHISREITRKMGGDLWLEASEVGKGSTFAFSLPKEKSETALKARNMIEKEAKYHPDQKSDIIESR